MINDEKLHDQSNPKTLKSTFTHQNVCSAKNFVLAVFFSPVLSYKNCICNKAMQLLSSSTQSTHICYKKAGCLLFSLWTTSFLCRNVNELQLFVLLQPILKWYATDISASISKCQHISSVVQPDTNTMCKCTCYSKFMYMVCFKQESSAPKPARKDVSSFIKYTQAACT